MEIKDILFVSLWFQGFVAVAVIVLGTMGKDILERIADNLTPVAVAPGPTAKGAAKPAPTKVSYYEGIEMLREGKILGLTDYEAQLSHIRLGSRDGEPGWYTGRAEEKADRPFRGVTTAEAAGEFYVIPLPTPQEIHERASGIVGQILAHPLTAPTDWPPNMGFWVMGELVAQATGNNAPTVHMYIMRLDREWQVLFNRECAWRIPEDGKR